MENVSKISSGGIVYDVKDKIARDDNLILFQQVNGLYKGRDLTTVFADEIANFSDAWAWIKNRIQNVNYTGIYVGDYIPITMNSETVEMQVAGIDVYTHGTGKNLGHHIDFISRDCFSETVPWNLNDNYNNGNAASPHPYMVSNLHTWLTETLYSYLPQEVKAQIVTKRSLLESRYSASGVLTDSTAVAWKDMGLLWVPHEYEVFGSVVWATKGYGAGQAMQYPIFANSYCNRTKRAGKNGSLCGWWLASVGSGSSTSACNVSTYGYAGSWITSGLYHAPVCFRIAE